MYYNKTTNNPCMRMKPKVKDAIFIFEGAAAELIGEIGGEAEAVAEGVGSRIGIMEDGSKLGVNVEIEAVAVVVDEAEVLNPDVKFKLVLVRLVRPARLMAVDVEFKYQSAPFKSGIVFMIHPRD
jgi:hypothetical protein